MGKPGGGDLGNEMPVVCCLIGTCIPSSVGRGPAKQYYMLNTGMQRARLQTHAC